MGHRGNIKPGPETDNAAYLIQRFLNSLTICLLCCLGCDIIYVVKRYEQIKNLFSEKTFLTRGQEDFPYLQAKFLSEALGPGSSNAVLAVVITLSLNTVYCI